MNDPTDTRTEWFTATNPDALLDIACPRNGYYRSMVQAGIVSQPDSRRLQLFGCACARMVWELLPTDARNAVQVRERYANDRAAEADMRAAALRAPGPAVTAAQHAAACAANSGGYRLRASEFPPGWDPLDAARCAAKALAARAVSPVPPDCRRVTKGWHEAWNAAFAAARAHQAELVRDIFPPPHAAEALRLEPAWLTSTVLTLARQADDTGEYGLLPILADALQDAGCDNEFMLNRCRAESGIHARGNWVVDLLLGRE